MKFNESCLRHNKKDNKSNERSIKTTPIADAVTKKKKIALHSHAVLSSVYKISALKQNIFNRINLSLTTISAFLQLYQSLK